MKFNYSQLLSSLSNKEITRVKDEENRVIPKHHIASNNRMLDLCLKSGVSPKSGMDLLTEVERKAGTTLKPNQVDLIFDAALKVGFFRARLVAPNYWRSESSPERCYGSPFSKGIEEEDLI